MSRVIKNNDGVAVVEGTPAASLVKDVDKFFAAKPPERMAGESISQPRRLNRRSINTKTPTAADLEQMNNPPSREAGGNKIMSEAEYKADATRRIKEGIKRGVQLSPEPYSSYLEKQQPGYEENRKARLQEELEKYKRAETPINKSERQVTPRRNEARDKAKSRRKRFFERRKSRKEAERSQTEQEATQGKFITTLGR